MDERVKGPQAIDVANAPLWDAGDLDLEAMVLSPSMSELLQAIIAWAVELLHADAGETFLWDQDKGRLIQSIGYGSMESYIGLALEPGEGIVGTVFESGQPMIVDDYLSWPGRLDVCTLSGPTTGITVPMKWQERAVGVLGLTADPQRRTFGQDDIQRITLFASLAALAIHNHRLCDALQDRTQTLKAILEREVAERTAELPRRALQLETGARVSRQITSILDTEALVPSVVDLISRSFDYPYVLICLLDEASDTLALRTSSPSQQPRKYLVRITGVETMQVSLPKRRPHEWATSITPVGTGYVLVQLHTDEGIVGLGKAPALIEWGGDHMRYYGESPRTVMHLIENFLVPAIVGHDPLRISHIQGIVDRTVKGHPHAKAALDFGLHDLAGKILDVPLYQLFSGCYRQWVPIAHSIGIMSIDAAVQEAVQAVAEGIRTIKLKVGKDPLKDVELVKAVRQAVGADIRTTVDGNQGYPHAEAATALLRRMEPHDMEFAEQPVEGLESMARVARAVTIPLMADKSAWTPHDVVRIRDMNAASYISLYTTKPGGLYKAMKAATLAETWGFPCNVNGSAETGVGNAANLHLAAAAPVVTLSSLIMATTLEGREQTATAGTVYLDDIVTNPFEYRDGCMLVPDGPGPGVELDLSKPEIYRQS